MAEGPVEAGAGFVFAYIAMRNPPRSFTEMTFAIAVIIAGLVAFVTAMTLIAKMLLDRGQEHPQTLARTDPLTGSLNQRGFSDAFQHLVDSAPSAGLAMIIFDLDHFKQINDRHGHQVGDRVLLEFSATCKAHLPQRAAFGRTGGEEFAAVLAVNEPKDAALFAETVRMAFAERAINAETQRIHVTTSVGIAVAPLAIADLEAMMAQADTALYAAKAEGRNRTSVNANGKVVTVPPARSDNLDAQADRQVAILKRIAAVGNNLHD